MSLRSVGIRARLVVQAAGFVLFLAVVAAIGYAQIAAGTSAAASLDHGRLLQSAAQTVQYDFADLNGWQNAYAFSAARQGPAGAADTADNRKEFLVVAARTRTDLGHLVDLLAAATGTGAGDQRQLANAARDKFEQFMTVDAKIAGLYRQSGTAAAAAGDNLVNGEEVTLYVAAHTESGTASGSPRGWP